MATSAEHHVAVDTLGVMLAVVAVAVGTADTADQALLAAHASFTFRTFVTQLSALLKSSRLLLLTCLLIASFQCRLARSEGPVPTSW